MWVLGIGLFSGKVGGFGVWFRPSCLIDVVAKKKVNIALARGLTCNS